MWMPRCALMGWSLIACAFVNGQPAKAPGAPLPPVMQRALNDVAAKQSANALLRRAVQEFQAKSPCSVPLLKMPIPGGVEFAIQSVRPQNKVAPMPRAPLPAPACNLTQ